MLYEPLLAHQLAKQRSQDILHEMEQARLICLAEDCRKSQEERLPIASIFEHVVAIFARPLI